MEEEIMTTTENTGAEGGLFADYIALLQSQLADLAQTQSDAVDAAAEVIAQTIAADGLVHIFGTGHSHLLAAEMFYRAGGLAAINPILVEGLLLHAGAELSTTLERVPGLGEVIFAKLGATSADTLIVISNSGANVVARELLGLAQALGMTVIAITSLAHATSAAARGGGALRLHELADIVIDNRGVPGDAAVAVPGIATPMGPTSTAIGAAIINGLAVSAAAKLAARGTAPVVFSSSNVEGGDAANAAALERYRPRVRSL